MNLGLKKKSGICQDDRRLWENSMLLKRNSNGNLQRTIIPLSRTCQELVTGTIDVQWPGKDPKSQIVVPSMDVDENFTNVFQMKVLNGRSFSPDLKATVLVT